MSSLFEDAISPDVNLPPREFMYTIEQVAQLLDVSVGFVEKSVCHFYGRSVGSSRGKAITINVALPDQKPVWRISETEFKIWMRYKKIKFTQQTNVKLVQKSKRY